MVTTKTPATVAAPKAKRTPASLIVRITTQLDRAVLGKKVTKDELASLASHISKLDNFLG